MATLQVGEAYPGEVNDADNFDFGVLLTLPVVTSTSTTFAVEVYPGDRIIVTGVGLTYDQNSRLTGGTITGISETDNNPAFNSGAPLVFAISGLSVPAATFVSLAAANNDLGALQLLFGGADTMIGSTDPDRLLGFAGNDSLVGAGGNDTLEGGDDNDALRGGVGNDLLDGGSGNDTVRYDGAPDGITLDLRNQAAQHISASQGDDTIKNVESAFGGNGNDSIIGSDTPAVANGYILWGGQGDDTLVGGATFTFLFGGAGNDRLVGTFPNTSAAFNTLAGPEGVHVSLLESGHAQDIGGGYGFDTLINIQNLVGSNFNDTLIGDANANTITGMTGDDVITGGAGSDFILGVEGFDTAKFSGKLADYAFDVDANGGVIVRDLRSGSPDGTDHLFDIDSLVFADGARSAASLSAPRTVASSSGNGVINGGLGADNLNGGSGSDTVNAGAGDDKVDAGSGSDGIFGGSGNDTVDAGSGNDRVSGDAGNDSLSGGSGGDTLTGGAGNDTMDGGSSADRFVFGANSGNDVITDFRGGDHIELIDGQSFVSFQQVGGSTILHFAGADAVTLVGVTGLSNADVSNLFI